MSMRLIVTLSGRHLDTIVFDDSSKPIVIGRHEDCDVHLDHDGISRRHCEVVQVEGGHVLRDLGSSNGTFVKGRRIKSHTLNPGEKFSLCDLTLRYEADTVAPVIEPSPEIHFMPEMTFQVDREAEAKKLRGASRSRVRGHIIVLEGRYQRTILLAQCVTIIGKDPEADVRLSGRSDPRLAAMILRDDAGFWCLDVSPKGNCVEINGVKTAEVELRQDDDIVVQGVHMKYYPGIPRARRPNTETQSWQHPDIG